MAEFWVPTLILLQPNGGSGVGVAALPHRYSDKAACVASGKASVSSFDRPAHYVCTPALKGSTP